MDSAETHPDKLVDFWEWLVENRTQVLLVIIAALGIGMIVYVKKERRLQDEELAAEDFLAASNPGFKVDGGNTNLATSARLQKVADDNPGTTAAINASFLAASSLFDERAYAEAEKAFERFYSSNPSSALAPAAWFGKAASLDAAGQAGGAMKGDRLWLAEGAIKGYESVISQFPKSPEAMQSRVALAKLYLAQAAPDTAKAKELLGQVTEGSQSRFVPGFWANEARRLSDNLEPTGEAEEGPTKSKPPATKINPEKSEKPAKQPKKTNPPLKEEKKKSK